MLPGSVPPSLALSSELDFMPMPRAVTPVFFSSELASRLPPPAPQASPFANEAEYSSQGCIDPSLLTIAPSAPATNANLASSPDAVNPPDTVSSPDVASLPGIQRPETADEGSNVGDLHDFIFF
jgi:hypothetical protein